MGDMPIDIARSRPGLRNLFDSFDDDIKGYFVEFRKLVESDFSLQVILAYAFFRLEQGQRTTLFCGARKLHKTDSDITWKAIDGHYMSRENFQKFFDTIFGVAIPATILGVIERRKTFVTDLCMDVVWMMVRLERQFRVFFIMPIKSTHSWVAAMWVSVHLSEICAALPGASRLSTKVRLGGS
jgi:hypothetical protein